MIGKIQPVLGVTAGTILKGDCSGVATTVVLTTGDSIAGSVGTSARGQCSGSDGTRSPVETRRAGSSIVNVTHTVAGGSWGTLSGKYLLDGEESEEK